MNTRRTLVVTAAVIALGALAVPTAGRHHLDRHQAQLRQGYSAVV